MDKNHSLHYFTEHRNCKHYLSKVNTGFVYRELRRRWSLHWIIPLITCLFLWKAVASLIVTVLQTDFSPAERWC